MTHQIQTTSNMESIANSFSENFVDIDKQISIYGKTINEWNKYFSVDVSVDGNSVENDFNSIRLKLIDISNKLDECSYIIAHLKLFLGSNAYEIHVSASDLFAQLSKAEKATYSKIERQIKQATSNQQGQAKLAEMFLDVFIEFQNRLKKKAELLQTILQSYMSELRRISSNLI